jgi:hypothetical protein
MGVTMAQLFTEDGRKVEALDLPSRPAAKLSKNHSKVLNKLAALIPGMSESDQSMLLHLAQKMARR